MTCARLWEVEAVRDGRLTGAESSSFRRHASACAECGAEARALDSLRSRLRDIPFVEPTELETRRQRQLLLAEIDADMVGRAAPSLSRAAWLARGAIAAGGFAIAASVAWLALESRSAPDRAPRPIATVEPLVLSRSHQALAVAPVLEAHADEGTRFSQAHDGTIERISLEDGTLSIHVRRAQGGRVIVRLPDGELEDIGTTFTVTVSGAHTRGVSVSEGAVVVRLRGREPVQVKAGDSWSPVAAPQLSASAKPSAPATVSALPAMNPASPASLEFESAMSAFRGGDYGTSADRFARFERGHGTDPRAQDAAYLRVLALTRGGGRHDDARAAARDYLARFPNGFRRPEVKAIAESP